LCVAFLAKTSSQDERDEDVIFSFDKVFYEDAEQSDVYNFLAVPIVSGFGSSTPLWISSRNNQTVIPYCTVFFS
jgi:hypothetical protein